MRAEITDALELARTPSAARNGAPVSPRRGTPLRAAAACCTVSPLPPGTYTIEVEVNPAYAPGMNGVCPRVTDPLTGLCHQLAEASYTNNVGRATVFITDHPGRAGYGPFKNDKSVITASDEVEK